MLERETSNIHFTLNLTSHQVPFSAFSPFASPVPPSLRLSLSPLHVPFLNQGYLPGEREDVYSYSSPAS